MSKNIHKTAIIEDGAIIGEGVTIGAFCVVGPHVVLEKNVTLKSHVVVDGHTTIGEGTTVYPFASLGAPPQDLKYAGEPSKLLIGKNNVIREYTTMHPGTKTGHMKTVIGDNCLFMASTHVAHDCVIGNNVIFAHNAIVGGHVEIGDHAILGGMAAVHQFVRVGAYAIVGGLSAIESDIIPYGRAKGERATLSGLNLIGIERQGFSKDQIKNMQRAFNQLFGDEGTLEQRIAAVAQDFANDEAVGSIIKFAQQESKFALCQPARKN
jgi:UDP-N-acetylglucosamine acyltransferase